MDVQLVTPFAALGRSFLVLMLDSGPFARVILLVIFVLSVISWAVIYDRTKLYMKLRKGGRTLQQGLATKGLSMPAETVEQCMPSIEGAMLIETKRFLEGSSSRPGGKSPAALKDLLDGRATTEISEMEKYLVFLATTATVSPFLGLLGTVWGIMTSFLSMGAEGTASIDVVGPGIAEALVTTIAGLGAAITALVGYNLLVRHVRRQGTLIDLFISRVLILTSDYFTRPSQSKSEAPYEKKSI